MKQQPLRSVFPAPSYLHRFIRQLDLTGLHVGRVVTAAAVRIAAAFASEVAVIQPGTRQERLLHDFLREIVWRRRADGSELDRIIVDPILVLGDR